MKKLVAISIVLVLLAPAVFAEVAVSAGVHGVLVPIEIEAIKDADDQVHAGSIIGWGGDRGRYAQITFAGETEDGKVGFKTQINVGENYGTDFLSGGILTGHTDTPITLDDWAGLWIKPIDQFRITVGRFQQDDIRGKIGANDGWALAALAAKGEDNIFSRFTGNAAGTLLDIYPVPGLGIHFLVNGLDSTAYAGGSYPAYTLAGVPTSTGSLVPAYRVYERFQLAVSYELEGLGLVRVQYLNADADGYNTRDGSDPIVNLAGATNNGVPLLEWGATGRRIEAAFAFTAVEGLTVDFGVKIPFRFKFADDNDPTISGLIGYTPGFLDTFKFYRQSPWQASVGVNGTFGSFGIWTRLDTYFLGNAKIEADIGGVGDYYLQVNDPFIVAFAIEPSYDLGFGTVGLYFAVEGASNYKTKTDIPFTPNETVGGGGKAGFGAWFKVPVGGGALKPGIAYRVGSDKVYSYYGQRNAFFSIPIEFDFSF